MEKMKILVLVISSSGEPVYRYHKKIWRSYCNSHSQFTTYFLESGSGNDCDTIYIPGEESLRHILTKTVYAFEHVNILEYDFIIRTNLSSLWNFTRTYEMLQLLPKENVYAGAFCSYYNVMYASGSGMIFTPDVCKKLLDNKDRLFEINIVDDVDIGSVMKELNIPLITLPKVDILRPDCTVNDGFHYRVKMIYGDCRMYEYTIMRNLLLKQ